MSPLSGGYIVRLELEGMREAVTHAMSLHRKEIEAELDANLKQVIETFDFDGTVRREAQAALQEGIRQVIKDVVFHSVMTGPIRSELEMLIHQAMKKLLEKDFGIHG